MTQLAKDLGLHKSTVTLTLDAWEARKGVDVWGPNISTDSMTHIARVTKKDKKAGERALEPHRKAGEIVEDAPSQGPPKAFTATTLGGKLQRGHAQGERMKIRAELGISESESRGIQALAKIPEPVFEEFAEKVRAREEEGGRDAPHRPPVAHKT